jgi:MoxR-like ATPase
MKEIIQQIVHNVEGVILGKTDRIKLVLCGWFAGGHVLLEDVPGTGKTMLARAIAQSVQGTFKRIQFTPDLLPSDVLGTTVYSQQSHQFLFQKGPVFTSILLADEINRATPRTQSALLEAMAENQVTIDGRAFQLDPSFFVLATQNPIEHHGTFPLPEAQLDRFMLKFSLGYPNRENEIQMVKAQNSQHPIHSLKSVATLEQIQAIRAAVPQVKVSEEIHQYVLNLVEKTRSHPDLRLGASPRATLALVRASQAMALIEGRSYVSPSNVYQLVHPILAHRLALSSEARLKGLRVEEVLTQLVSEVPVPTGGAVGGVPARAT